MNNHRTIRGGTPVAGPYAARLDVLLGAVAGAVGVWAMDQVGWLMLRMENTHTLARDLDARDGDAAGNAGTVTQIRAVQASTSGESSAAGALKKATQVSGVSPTNQRPGPAAAVFHYALGVLPGALYSAVRRTRPAVRTGSGVLYGVVLFVVMDETAAPLTGIASPPGRYPWQAHAGGLVAHVVLGMTTETFLRAVDRLRRT